MKTKCIYAALVALSYSSLLMATSENESQYSPAPVQVSDLPPDNDSGTTYQIRTSIVLGKFAAANLDEALDKQFIDETKLTRRLDAEEGGKKWMLFKGKKERTKIESIPFEDEGSSEFFSVYFSFWIYSQREILPKDDLKFYFYASSKGKLFLNGTALDPSSYDPVDQRMQYVYKKLEMKDGWNNFVIKLAGVPKSLESDANEEASLALRIAGPSQLLESLQFCPEMPK